MIAPLLTTKLYMPPLRAESVSRPRLIERLNAGRDQRLTLVSAPAGFGKTTLLVEWLNAAIRSAWLSLDQEDNDPARFYAYLIAALERVCPGAGAEARALLQSPQPPPFQPVLTLLINELAAAPGRFVLVLDDYHVIERPVIHDALAFLIEHQPPQMHLVLACRADPPLPVARLRTRGQMTEIRAADLRFTAQEAATFLNDAMGLGLSAQDIESLEARTEGWISGLQLAALSMRSQAMEHRSAFVAAFGGSHRHVIDYLAQEVLARQPPDIRAFLRQTSILDRMTAPLCDAVTGRQDSSEVLRQLERDNLFLIPLDDQRQWYRYHRLFADFLRNHLLAESSEQIHDLYCRAADWYEQNGLPVEAVGLAIQAGEREWAARLIEQTALHVLMRGQVATVLGWFEALPDLLVRARPHLCIAYAAALTIVGQLDNVEAYLQQAECGAEGLEPVGDREAILSRVSAVRAYLAIFQGDLDRAMELAERAAQPLAPEDVFFRGIVSWLQGMTEYLSQGAAAARHKFAETARLSRASGSTLMTLLSIYASGFLCIIQGRLHQARETFEEGFDLAEAERRPQESSWSQKPALGVSLMYQGLGEVAREQNDLVRAERYLAHSVALAEQWGNAETLADSYALYARVKHALGDLSGAHEVMDKALQLGQEGQIADLTIRQMQAHQARLWIADDIQAVARWAEARQRDRDLAHPVDGQVVLYVQALEEHILAQLYIARGEHQEALDLLASHQATFEAPGWTGIVIETLVLQALALDGQGRTKEALDVLGHALALAQPEGYVRVFIDQGPQMARLLSIAVSPSTDGRPPVSGALTTYVAGLIRAFAQQDSMPPISSPDRAFDATTWPRVEAAQPGEPYLLDPLTDREIQVLHLLVAGLSNREIAQELVITLGTAKRHVSNIYSKLDVHSRVHAVARARALHLV